MTREETGPYKHDDTIKSPIALDRRQYSIPYGYFVVAILIIFYALSFADRQVLSLLIEPVKADIGLSDTAVGVLHGVTFAIFYTILGVPAGWLADRYHRPLLIGLAVLAWSMATVIFGLGNTFLHLFIARTFVAIGESVLSPCVYSLLADHLPSDRVGRAMSIYGFGITLGSGGAFMLGGVIVAYAEAGAATTLPLLGALAPWQYVFVTIGLGGAALSPLALFIRDNHRALRTSSQSRQQTHPVINPEPFALLREFLYRERILVSLHLSAFALLSSVNFACMAWIPTSGLRGLEIPVATIGWWYGLALVTGGSVGMWSAGWAADHLMKRGVPGAHFLVASVAALGLMPAAAGFAMADSETGFLMAAACLAVAGFSWLGIAPAAFQLLAPSGCRGLTASIYLLALGMVGMGVGPVGIPIMNKVLGKAPDQIGETLGVCVFTMAIAALVLLVFAQLVIKRRSGGAHSNG